MLRKVDKNLSESSSFTSESDNDKEETFQNSLSQIFTSVEKIPRVKKYVDEKKRAKTYTNPGNICSDFAIIWYNLKRESV